MTNTTEMTPMMAQYLDIKSGYPDALLFYRMGDFYELFFEDAEQAAAALDIALTRRGKHLGQDIAMCGVPHHASEGYLLTLIRKGFRVAICEQMESPAEAKKRGHKSVVRREVVRLVTPGTLTEDSLLQARAHNFLAAVCTVRDKAGLAWADISTGDVTVSGAGFAALAAQLARVAPRELLVSAGDYAHVAPIAADLGITLTEVEPTLFDSASGARRICGQYGVETLDAFGTFSRPQIGALAGILGYLELTQRGATALLRPPQIERPGGLMEIDAATRRNLELTQSLSGGRGGSLLASIDRTVTGPGARVLEARLTSPLTDPAAITRRLDAVGALTDDPGLCEDIRAGLRKVPDIERALSRLGLGRGAPRDLAAIRDGLRAAQALAARLAARGLPEVLIAAARDLSGHDAVRDALGDSLVDQPPVQLRDGGLVRDGHHQDLDQARALRDDTRAVIAALQAKYIDLAGVNSLKIKQNNVLGYFIETPASHAHKMTAAPLSETFIHRQTTANQVRFATLELNGLETRILGAAQRALELEREIFDGLVATVLDAGLALSAAARALAELDVTAALADIALMHGWVRPRIHSDTRFSITGGRHPVVEDALRRAGQQGFVANDCTLDGAAQAAARMWLLTGPNMAGKSTFLRQNAIIAILAQSGAFVPADAAEIGIVEQLFSRVGAADDLARGRSTFMVEMVETAAILNQARDRALVILDEIGRGTSTYDGLSIAWATLEHLHEANRCRTLFATHYHELTALAAKLDGLRTATVAVREWEGEVIFLHEVREGAADRSYGVQVARLAGLPEVVTQRAREILDRLEEGERSGDTPALVDDLPLFNARPAPPPAPKRASAVEDRLRDVLPDTLSPRDALDLVYELKGLSGDA